VDIFNDVSPSVVFISNNLVGRRSFLSRNVEEIPQGSGSGFIWDKEGHIVTNFHVVTGATTITVTLDDQSVHRAKVTGVYRDKEIAVLQIDVPPEKLRPIPVGTSKNLRVGMTTLAIGNPFGLDHTLTKGIISALDREIQALTRRSIADVIQTDAAINPGNSGGPLLNSRGQLIGINTAILSPSGVNAGIGFAVPVDVINRYVRQIIKDGEVSGAGLGVSLLSDSLANRWRIRGVILEVVEPDGAAGKSGLRGTRVRRDGTVTQLGDAIVALGGQNVEDIDSLRDALEDHEVGESVEVRYVRDKEEQTATVKLQSILLQR
jgi:S1-C subfamily serine protease